jgi:hypothetical protein
MKNILPFTINEAVDPDPRYKKQFSFFAFNAAGNLRDFGMGFKQAALSKMIKEFSDNDMIVIFYESGLYPKNVPKKYIEGFYTSSSKENDLKDISALMPFQF